MISSEHFIEEFVLNPVLKKKYVYRFTTITNNFLKNKKEIGIACIRDVEITFLGKVKDLFVFNLFTSKVTFQSKQSIQNEQLLKEDLYAFDTVHAGVNGKGEIVKIFNLTDMQKRWKATKQELRKDYEGFEFEDFLADITEVLEDEEQTVFYLKTPAMFGLYFHGLFGENDHAKMPVKRKTTLLDFDDTEITEEILANNKKAELIISAQKTDNFNNKIISDNEEIKSYWGKLCHNKEGLLLEGFLKVENESKNIIYSVLWVG